MTEMEDIIDTNIELKGTSFKPSQLSLIAPDLTLQKYLESGYRPSLRKFQEFKPIKLSNGGISRYDDLNNMTNVIGSSIVKCGDCTTICSISAGIIEDDFETINDYRMRLDEDIIFKEGEETFSKKRYCSVNTVVEIAKGLNGPPSNEEIELSEKIYETVLHSGLINKDYLKIKVGLKSINEQGEEVILEGGDEDIGGIKKNFSFVLYSRIQVFGRSGPLFDQCYASLLKALKDTKLPTVYLNERESHLRTRAGKRNANINIQSYDLVCDAVKFNQLKLTNDKLNWSSTIGILEYEEKSLLLTDLEGDAEDNVLQRISVVSNGDGEFSSVTIEKGEGGKITADVIKDALKLSNVRAKDMIRLI